MKLSFVAALLLPLTVVQAAPEEKVPMRCSFQAGPVPSHHAMGKNDIELTESLLVEAFNEHATNAFNHETGKAHPQQLYLTEVDIVDQVLFEVEVDEEGKGDGRRNLQSGHWTGNDSPAVFDYVHGNLDSMACRFCGRDNDNLDKRERRNLRALTKNVGTADRFKAKLIEQIPYFADSYCVMISCEGMKFDVSSGC